MDVPTDLPVVLEQLPAAISALRTEAESFQLDFYEQGLERYVTGTRVGEEVRLECVSLSLRWSPDPVIEVMGSADLERMLCSLRDRYLIAVDRVCPVLALAPAFSVWRSAGAGAKSVPGGRNDG